jgi:Flp pilus assembly pilin Flp
MTVVATLRRRVRATASTFWTIWTKYYEDEYGQDLVEYSLLMAFVALVGAAMYIGMGQTTNAIWGIVNTRLAAANQTS